MVRANKDATIKAAHYEALPEPFKRMILHDRKKPSMPAVVKFSDIPHYNHAFDEWNEEKARIRQGCINVIQKQRGGK